MANISAQLVKELREMTGAKMMDCKKALVETEGSIEKAVEFLEKKDLQMQLRSQVELLLKV